MTDSDDTRTPRRALRTTSVQESHGSFELVLSPVILGLIGWLIDRQAGTGPWITIVAVVFGLSGAVVKLVSQYKARMAALESTAPWAPSRRATP
jgi:F0F1-type ATP synthase assembly protein I